MTIDFTFFFLLVFLAAAIAGWDWPYIAKLMPIYVAAIPGMILVFIQIYRNATSWERRQPASSATEMDEVHEVKLERSTEIRRTVIFFAWLVSGAIAIWLLGIVIGLPLLVFFYALLEGREKWTTSLVMTACTYLLIWGLFEYMLESRWPPGLLFQ